MAATEMQDLNADADSCAALRDVADPDFVAVADGGDLLSFARVGPEARTYLDAGASGCLGVGVSYAMAAAWPAPRWPIPTMPAWPGRSAPTASASSGPRTCASPPPALANAPALVDVVASQTVVPSDARKGLGFVPDSQPLTASDDLERERRGLL